MGKKYTNSLLGDQKVGNIIFLINKILKRLKKICFLLNKKLYNQPSTIYSYIEV